MTDIVVADGTCHHVAVTVDGTGNRFYVDGTQVASGDLNYLDGNSSTSSFFSSVNQIDTMEVGAITESSGIIWEFNGLIDDARVFDRALSSSDVTELYDLGTNVAPTITLPGGAVNYTENDIATVIDSGATVSDPDSSDFATGTLTVDFTTAGTANDRLAINDQGAGVGNISISGGDVRYDSGSGPVTIGTFSGGTSGSDPLVVTLNATSDDPSVEALMRNITYQNVSVDPSTLSRTVRFVLTDGDGGTSNAAMKSVNVSGDNNLIVTTTSDTVDGTTTSIDALLADKGADGRISLHEAIIATNNTANGAGPDEIHFNIADPLVGGAHTIQVGSTLPTITDAVIIDGTTDPDFVSTPINELDGTAAGASVNGLTISGGSSTVRGLVINRFDGNGIRLITNGGNVIDGNYIGTDVSGANDLGNTSYGIYVLNADNNTIGGTTTAARNVVSGNDSSGIMLAGGGSANNTIQGNYIGTDAIGSASLGNTGHGVYFLVSSVNNTIGGTVAGAGNTIAYNTGNGVHAVNGTGNAIVANSIHSNTGLGIDLDADGVTANDIGDGDAGANNLQNSPVLTSAVTNGVDSVRIVGSLNSNISTTYRIEFFANTAADGSGYGEAERFLGFASVTTDGSGDASFAETLTVAVADGEFVTATATAIVDLGGGVYGDTSEFALNVAATTTPVITARETIDADGDGQIDQIRITTSEALDDDFTGLTITVTGYTVTGYSSDIANDNIFYVHLTEGGTADTGATPTVTVTANTSLSDASSNNIAVDASWLDADWLNRARITFDNAAQNTNDLDDFPVLVTISTADLASLDLNATVGADVRFADAITGNELKYEVESWDDGADTATIWVKVPKIDRSSNTDYIYVYYNHSGTATYDQSAADEQAVWDTSYQGVRHLDENGAAVADEFVDSSGAGNHGQGGSGSVGEVPTQSTSGNIGNAQTFDNTDDHVNIAYSASLGITSDITISAWVKRANSGDFANILTKGDCSFSWDYSLYIENDDKLTFFVGDTSPQVLASTAEIADTSWHFVSVVRSGTDVTFYIDGADAGGGGTMTGALGNDPDHVRLGFSEEADSAFGGTMDEVRLSSVGRSADWIAASYESQNGTFAFNNFGSEEAVTAGVTATDKAAAVIVTATDPDLPADTITFSVTAGADQAEFSTDSATGELTFNSAPDFEAPTDVDTNNVYDVQVTVSDGNGGSDVQLISVTVTNINDAPTITAIPDQTPVEDTATGAIAFTVGDAETAAGSLVPDGNITLGGSGASRTINILPRLNQTGGPATITVTVDDGMTTTQTTFDVTVMADNNAPTDITLSGSDIDENSANGTAIGNVSATDPDVGDSLTFSLTDNAGGRFAVDLNTGQLTVVNGSLLDFEVTSSHGITVRVTDSGGLFYDEAFTINVNGVNEAPTALGDSFSAGQLEDLAVAAGVIMVNDFDVDGDGDDITVVLVTGPAAGRLTLAADGSFTYTPVGSFSGLDQFTYYVADGTLDSAVAIVEIDVELTVVGVSTTAPQKAKPRPKLKPRSKLLIPSPNWHQRTLPTAKLQMRRRTMIRMRRRLRRPQTRPMRRRGRTAVRPSGATHQLRRSARLVVKYLFPSV